MRRARNGAAGQARADDTGGINGLGGAAAVVVAPNGGSVFVAGEVDSALAAFRRDPATGVLSFRAAALDGSGVDGLASTDGLAISPDGAHVYVAGFGDDAVAIFAPAFVSRRSTAQNGTALRKVMRAPVAG